MNEAQRYCRFRQLMTSVVVAVVGVVGAGNEYSYLSTYFNYQNSIALFI